MNKYLVLVSLAVLTAVTPAYPADLFPFGSTWKYFVGTQEASNPAEAWRERTFDDGAWTSGAAPIGYPSGDAGPLEATIQTMLPTSTAGGYTCVFLRQTFELANPGDLSQVALLVRYDDGYVVWINGTEVGRSATVALGPVTRTTLAGLHEVTDSEDSIVVSSNLTSLLVAGTNVVAIQLLNNASSSSDLFIDASLSTTSDEQPPVILAIDPVSGSVVTELTFINVVFDEGVAGVNAADLLINGVAATNVTVISPREYVFNFPQPPTGAVAVAWATNHGITDLASVFHPFAGGNWAYTLNPGAGASAVIISEFLTDNGTGIRDEDADRSDWIEVYNPGPADGNLGGWFLTDDGGDLAKWRFPAMVLGANKYLLVWASSKDRTNALAPLHTNFKLGAGGGYLALVDSRTNVVSEFNPYPAQQANISYGRDRVDPSIVGFFTTPTPGAQNSTGGPGFTQAPTFSLESGVFTNNSLTLSLTVPTNTTVRYTLNSSVPTNTSPVYAGPITFFTNMTIKARAFPTSGTLFPSPVVARTFIMLSNTVWNFTSKVPILVLSTGGRSIPASVAPGQPRMNGAFVAFDTFHGRSSLQGKTDFQGLAQFEIFGQTSAGFPKQPHTIEINDELGNDMAAPLLGMPAEADWKLRNPYSDKCLINDFLAYELFEQMGHYSCRRRLVEVFIDTNGGKLTYPQDYYGVLVLFEKIEIDKNRVNIAQLTPSMTNEPAITGGYMFKKDKDSTGDLGFSTAGGGGFGGQALKLHEPKPREVNNNPSHPQVVWLRNYLNRFEASMYSANWTNATGTNHYSHYIDVDAFVDQQLHVEFTKQIDGYRLSGYYSKDRNGKLKPEPVWDWNLSFGNADYLKGGKTNGWYWNEQDEGMTSNEHIWLRRLVYGNPNITGVQPNPAAIYGPGDADFRQKITDRWGVLRTNVLNGDRVLARIDELAVVLSEAAIRDFAKFPRLGSYIWPNPGGPPSWDMDYVRPTTYAGIISEMKKWTRGRYLWMDSQFLTGPTLSHNGGPIQPGFVFQISGATGTIYYTLDGTDPRLPGGGISPAAKVYTNDLTLADNARVFARAHVTSPTNYWTQWSPPAAATYVVQTPKLVITEIMYHPAAPAVGSSYVADDFQYLELMNVESNALNIGGYQLLNGLQFAFSNNTVLAAGERVLLVRNQAAFETRYGTNVVRIVGAFTNNLSNAGERVTLVGKLLEPILDFTYADSWYGTSDGLGYALAIRDPYGALTNWSNPLAWRASASGGSPGQADPSLPGIAPILVNEALTHTDPPLVDFIELYNPTGTNVNIGGWLLTDDRLTPRKFRIPDNTMIAAGGYAVFYATNSFNSTNPTTGALIPFDLRASGDEVYLYSADPVTTNLTGYAHGFDYGAALNGVSFGRHVNTIGEDHFVAQILRTPGAANSGPKVGPIVISEVMYRPPALSPEGVVYGDPEDEYIELYNNTDAPVPLYDPNFPTNAWTLRDAVLYQFPTNQVIAARSYVLVVHFDPADLIQLASFRARYGVPVTVPIYGPYQKQLGNSSDSVELVLADLVVFYQTNAVVTGVLLDKVRYNNVWPWPVGADGFGPSLQRIAVGTYGNDPSNWRAAAPTPGTGYTGGAAPTITTQPTNTVTVAGTAAALRVSANGSGTLLYQWRFNGQNIYTGTNSTLTLSNAQPINEGEYVVVVYDANNSVASSSASLTVLVPINIVQQPLSQGIFPGQNATFTVSASGTGPFSFQWRFNGADIAGATNSIYVVANAQSSQSGDYSVRITSPAVSTLSSNATLTVFTQPVITQQPRSTNVVANVNVTFSVRANSGSVIRYQWTFNGSPIPGATSSNLTLTSVQLTNSGNYTVRLTDDYGTVTSQTATLIVLVTPQIRQEPQSQTVAVGEDVNLTAGAFGTMPMSYRWRKGSVNLTNMIVNATNSTYRLLNIRTNDAGFYNVAITNLAGPSPRLTSNAYVTVVIAPTNQTVQPGTNVTFAVVAVGVAPIFYQWQFNGTNLPGATNTSLSLSNVQPADAGPYAVVVNVVTNVAVAPAAFGAALIVGLDTDGDGLPDDWEMAHGLNPNNPNDANLDSDGDGLTNLQEYRAGTDPQSAQSTFKLAAVVTGGGGTGSAVVLNFGTVANRSYTIQCRDSLDGTSVWVNLTNIAASAGGGVVQFTNQFGGVRQRFYRLVTPAQP